MKLIGEKWQTIPKGSKIFLLEDKYFYTLDKEKIKFKEGFWYIKGFWANVVGLSRKRKNNTGQICDYYISSKCLEEFYEVKK